MKPLKHVDLTGDSNKFEKNLDNVIKKFEVLEEERARHIAMRALEEKRLQELEAEKEGWRWKCRDNMIFFSKSCSKQCRNVCLISSSLRWE